VEWCYCGNTSNRRRCINDKRSTEHEVGILSVCKPRHKCIDIAIEKVLLQYWREAHPKYSQENTNNTYQGKI
jgi:hypothetical protein